MKEEREVNQGKPKIGPEKLRLLCRKCNTDWIEERPMGYLVRYKKDNNYLINREYGHKKYFKCPKCGSRSKISRLPVVDVMRLKLRKKNKEDMEYFMPKRDIIELKEVG